MTDLADIRQRLDALRRRLVAALAMDGGARVALCLLGAVAVSFLLDRVFRLETAARAVLLCAGLGALGWVSWRYLVRRLRAVPGEDPLAVAVEARHPQLGDRLISALQLAREPDPERYGMSPQLIEDAIREAVEPVRSVRFGDVLDTRRVAKRCALGLLALGLLAAGAAAKPSLAGIWFQRNVLLRDVRWPQETYLVVDEEIFRDGVARIVRGGDLVVTARIDEVRSKVFPDRVTIHYEDSEGDRGKAAMKAEVGRHVFRYEFTDIAFPITFHLEGGDDVTRDYRIAILEPPEVAELEVLVGFPDYANREPVAADLSLGDPEMLKGGFVTIRGRSSKPLESASLVIGESEQNALDCAVPGGVGSDRFEVTLRPEDTILAGIRLRDTDGLSNPSLSPRFLVRVVEDRAPKVRFNKHGVGALVVAGAVVPWTARIHDDVRIAKGRIEVLKSAGDRQAPAPHVIELPEGELGRPEVELEGELELGPLELTPGAFLTLSALASDSAQPEPHEGKSDPFTLKVVTLEELANDLLGRQQEQRRLFEELIQREKRLRDRFLDLKDHPPGPAELGIQLESEGQDQREIARRVLTIERAFDQIFDEMLYNRISEPATVGHLRRTIVDSLGRLREQTMAGHARRLDDGARRSSSLALTGRDGQEIEDGYEEVLKAMDAVLGLMEKGEAFSEIVETVRSIIKSQGQVRDATHSKYEAVLKDIFGEDARLPDDDKDDDKDKDK